MKRIATLALISGLATAGAVSAQQSTEAESDPFLATAGPNVVGMGPGLFVTLIGLAIFSFSLATLGSSSGTD